MFRKLSLFFFMIHSPLLRSNKNTPEPKTIREKKPAPEGDFLVTKKIYVKTKRKTKRLFSHQVRPMKKLPKNVKLKTYTKSVFSH